MVPVRRRWQRWLLVLARPRAPESLPVTLDRRRVYVLPTGFGLFFATLLLAMVVGALNYNNNPALLLAMLLAGAGLASLVGAQLQLTGLAVTAIEAGPVAAGEPLTVRLHAQAPADRVRRGLRLDVEEASWPNAGDGPVAIAAARLDLDHGHGEAELAWPTRHRGWLDLPRLRLSTTRPLGLARAWSYVWTDAPLLVYPAPEPHGPPLPAGVGGQAQTRVHATGDDVHHLRAYRAGDSRRAIAWKPSARRDSLVVREYEQPIGADVELAWRDLAGLGTEARIARLARWVDEADRDGRRYRLVLPLQPAIGPARGAQHRHACLRALALLPASA